MSIADPLVVTYDSVSKNLARVNQDAGNSEFYLDDGTIKFSASVKHTIPANPASGGESHALRLDASYFDVDGLFLRKGSVWLAMRMDGVPQVTADMQKLGDAFLTVATSGNIAKLLAREN